MQRLQRRAVGQGDEGFALMIVLFSILIMTTVALVVVASTMREIGSSSHSRDFEAALGEAEAAAEAAAQHVTIDPTYVTTAANGAAQTMPSGYTDAQQRAWVVSQFQAALSAGSPSVVAMPGAGVTYAVRPLDQATGQPGGAVYGLAAVGPKMLTRVVRMRVGAQTYTFQRAIVTDKDLTITNNASVNGSVAGAHSNGNMSVSNNALISGTADASGTRNCAAQAMCQPTSNAAASGVPPFSLPDIRARQFYAAGAAQPNTWLDLCPDAKVRRWSAAGPCDPNAAVVTGSGWQWLKEGNLHFMHWIYQGANFTTPMAFYAHQSSLEFFNNVTGTAVLFASRDPAVNDPTQGNIENNNNAAINVPASYPGLPTGLFVVADRDVWLTNNTVTASPAMVFAGEQVHLDNNANFNGAVMGLDNKYWGGPIDTPGSPVPADSIDNNANINYNGNLSITPNSSSQISGWREL